jgi:hypothetical protein
MLDNMTNSEARWRPRLSVLNALLLLTITGMALVVIQLWREVGPLRNELRRVRDRNGALSIEDQTKFHAIKLESHAPFTWNWRIWIPDGQTYELRYISEDIPPTGFPAVRGTILHGPDEQWVGHRIRKDSHSGKRVSQLVTQQGTVTGSEQNWIGKSRDGEVDGVQKETEMFETGETIELIRSRYSKVDDNSDFGKPGDGFMIWLVPLTASKKTSEIND